MLCVLEESQCFTMFESWLWDLSWSWWQDSLEETRKKRHEKDKCLKKCLNLKCNLVDGHNLVDEHDWLSFTVCHFVSFGDFMSIFWLLVSWDDIGSRLSNVQDVGCSSANLMICKVQILHCLDSHCVTFTHVVGDERVTLQGSQERRSCMKKKEGTNSGKLFSLNINVEVEDDSEFEYNNLILSRRSCWDFERESHKKWCLLL